MHATHGTDVKNVIAYAALEQGKLSWRSSWSRYHWEFHDGSERRAKSLKKHKHFVFKGTMLFVKIQILIMIRIGINNLKFLFYNYKLHSSLTEKE